MVFKTLILIFVLFMGCGDFNSFNTTINSNNNSDEPILLELYMNYPIENGYYKINFPDNSPHSYTSVEYQTEGMRRIYWTSLDSFTIVHMGYLITEPIINYSTYSRDDGSGKQMIYLDQDFINDTLMIRGCISESNCEELEFIIY